MTIDKKTSTWDWQNAEPAEDAGPADPNLPPAWPDHEADARALDEVIEKLKDPNLTPEERKVLEREAEVRAWAERLSR